MIRTSSGSWRRAYLISWLGSRCRAWISACPDPEPGCCTTSTDARLAGSAAGGGGFGPPPAAVGVDEDAVEPSLEVSAGLGLMERGAGRGERLLDQLLGIAGVAGHQQPQAIEPTQVRQRVTLEARRAPVPGILYRAGHRCHRRTVTRAEQPSDSPGRPTDRGHDRPTGMTLLAIGASARQPGQTLLQGIPGMIHWRVLAAASDIAGALTLPYPVRLVPRERLSATDIRIPRIERKHLRPLTLRNALASSRMRFMSAPRRSWSPPL
jgi:hypothetical protein